MAALKASINVLYSVRAATGSQWRERRRGETCENLGWLKTSRAAAFITKLMILLLDELLLHYET